MARKSLRPHLNQIRTWVRQGRTDAWVAHQLEVSVKEIEQFKRQNDLLGEEEQGEGSGAGDYPEEIDLRAEDDALIAAELEAAEAEAQRIREEADAAGEEDSDDERPRPARGAAGAAGGGAPRAAHPRSRAPSTTVRRGTGCGSTPRSRTTPSTPSTGPGTGPWRSPWRRTGS